MTRVFNDYARRINELKEKDKNLDGNDIREGLTLSFSFNSLILLA
jgi:topoisomerase-4 subunit B